MKTLDSRSRAVEVDPDRGLFAYRSQKRRRQPVARRWRSEVTAAGTATRVRVTEIHPKTLLRKRLIAPVRRRRLERAGHQSLTTLNEQCSRSHPGETTMITTEADQLDYGKLEAFGERVVNVLNDACLALMTSIGHKTGLFDTMAELQPSTSLEVAAAAGLQERYVREWLGAMTTGGIVEYDGGTGTSRLPPEHAAFLSRASGTDNLAVTAQFIALLGSVEGEVARCFRAGGGVPYSAYTEFHRLMAEDSALVHDAALIGVILPLVPRLSERLTAGIDVADIGCGSGHAINLMARAYPNSRFTGFDFSEEGIAAGRAEAERLGLTNAMFELRDVTDLQIAGGYDFITAFDAIHDQAKPATVLANIARALRPDGVFLMVDIRASSQLEENLDHMLGPFLYTVSTMHCMTVSLALDGDGLGSAWGRQLATKMLHDAGFTSVDITTVDGDLFNDYFIVRKG